eukprot:TRINITY_DN11757_c0_g1_i1.p1 TRINITY_DN11757_c0_g1~~TRINITY_DN11757_c0_g1_i1.p1  ORF type:complete len:359 (-),score=70.91 TRINITY_DN11757_c0_g1_i1:130-1206(-)
MSAPVAIQHRHDWPVVITGATLLCVHAGFINAVTVYSLGNAVSHATGHYTNLGVFTQRGSLTDAAWVFGLLLSFCVGCMVSGVFVGQSKFIASQPYGQMLLAIGFVEVLATLLLSYFDKDLFCLYLLAFGCGLQNALCTTWSGAVVRTTHFTGMITDTGLVIGHWLRYKLNLKDEWEPEAADTWKLLLFLPMMVGFVTGAWMGTFTYTHFDYWGLLVPAIAIGVCGIVYRWLMRESKYFAYYRYKKVMQKRLGLSNRKRSQRSGDNSTFGFRVGKTFTREKMSSARDEQTETELESISPELVPELENDCLIELEEEEQELREQQQEQEDYESFQESQAREEEEALQSKRYSSNFYQKF